jgi:hypothetical protein
VSIPQFTHRRDHGVGAERKAAQTDGAACAGAPLTPGKDRNGVPAA